MVEIKPKNLAQRILEIYKSVTSVIKDDSVKAGGESYKAVSHDAVTKLLHKPVADAGIIIVPTQNSFHLESFEKPNKFGDMVKWYLVKMQVTAKFINADDPADFIESVAFGYSLDTSDKAMGKAYSYALKTIYLKVFMLESADGEENRDFENQTYNDNYNARGNYRPPAQKQNQAPPPAGKPAFGPNAGATSAPPPPVANPNEWADQIPPPADTDFNYGANEVEQPSYIQNYVVDFGKKYNGHRFLDIPSKDAMSYCKFLETSAKTKNQAIDPDGPVGKFILAAAEAYGYGRS